MFTARRIKTERPFKELYRVYLQEREDAAAVEAEAVSYTHLRAHETRHDLVCRLLLDKKKSPDL